MFVTKKSKWGTAYDHILTAFRTYREYPSKGHDLHLTLRYFKIVSVVLIAAKNIFTLLEYHPIICEQLMYYAFLQGMFIVHSESFNIPSLTTRMTVLKKLINLVYKYI